MVNYFTLKTMDAVAGAIGYVKVIEYDPEKPHLLEYVRVQVIMDLHNPLRDTKLVNLSKGCSATVDIEYESSKEVLPLSTSISRETEMPSPEKRQRQKLSAHRTTA